MADSWLEETVALVAAVNAARGWAGAPERLASSEADAERQLDTRFGACRTLAVYGTLAPGRSNHHVVAPLGGAWTTGFVEGDLSDGGWGKTLGYPGLRPRAGATSVAVHVLRSDALPAAWPDLDAFEGPEYQRILVPVFRAGPRGPSLHTVANLYAVAP